MTQQTNNNKLRKRWWFVKACSEKQKLRKKEYLEERAHSCGKLRADSDALTASLGKGTACGSCRWREGPRSKL